MTTECKESFYSKIEEPIKNLIKLLRDNGFNTICSCGHYPKPYVDMEWYSDDDVTKLFLLIIENGYRNFSITGTWQYCDNIEEESNKRCLRIEFNIKCPLSKETDFRIV